MNFKRVGDKAEKIFIPVKNDEPSATIKIGSPIVFSFDGTDDGVAVVLPSTAVAAMQAAASVGIMAGDITPGVTGQAQVYGLCLSTRVVRATRALPTDPWPAAAAVTAKGLQLTMDVVNNAFTVGAAATGKVSVLLAQQIPAYAGGPAAVGDTSLALIVLVKSFVRMLG